MGIPPKIGKRFALMLVISIFLIFSLDRMFSVNAIGIPSYMDENFEVKEKYSHIINLTKNNYIIYDIRTKNSPFIINITRLNDTHIENILYSNPNSDSIWIHRYFGQINIFSLKGAPVEYNITIINNGTISDVLSFSMKIYENQPMPIVGINLDMDFISSWIMGIISSLLPLILIAFSRFISRIRPPSKRKIYLKRFGGVILISISGFYIIILSMFCTANFQNVNSDIYELNIGRGIGMLNRPIMNPDENSVIIEWTETYKKGEEGLFLKHIELVNSNDDNYTIVLQHNATIQGDSQKLTDFKRVTIPKGEYLILGGNGTKVYCSNIVSDQSIDGTTKDIFTVSYFIVAISLLYYISTYRFKLNVQK